MNCTFCSKPFSVEEKDLEFYKKMDVPSPAVCPKCRQLQRMLFRNERTFYQNTCAWCQAPMVSCFSPSSPFTVLCNNCWWSDKFDPLKYGRDFDFNRPFFDQFWDLMKAVPVGNLFIASSENSDYSNYCVSNKNCYMASASDYNQDSFYVDNSNENLDVCDVSFTTKSQLVYEGIDLFNAYNCTFSSSLRNCSFCTYCEDCIGCSDCIGCVGLRNAKYCIFNEQLSKEKYVESLNQFKLFTHSGVSLLAKQFEKFRTTQTLRESHNLNSEECTGDYLVNCKNCLDCADMYESQDCRYSSLGYKVKDVYDTYGMTQSQLGYQSVASGGSYNVKFSCIIWPGSRDLSYCLLARSAKNCFGCTSLHKNEYCILNKQYSKESFDKLRMTIIENMKRPSTGSGQAGEWGNLFPMKYAPWAYNETIAQDFYPLNKEQVEKIGARWQDQLPGTFGLETKKADEIPDNIRDTDEKLINEVFACKTCKRNYRIILQELIFYKKIGVPLPRYCPSCRYKGRMNIHTGSPTFH